MSQTIDEKVVALRFNNAQFEKKVESTLRDVERLNKGLELKGASKGLEKVVDATNRLDFSHMGKSIGVVRAKIGAFQTMTLTAVHRMTNGLIDLNKRVIDLFAIQPVTTGFNEYELKMGSVQTIMASTGESVKAVNKYLDELNEYSDRTIYSFSDMTESIGKFTNAGVDLKTSVQAIKGISNEAADSGANANEASRAMYNFGQAISSGYVKLMDWRSIELANMATVKFKNALLDTAAEVGTVSKTAEGMYQVLTTSATGSGMKDVINATKNFNDSLQYQWLTSDVLIKTLAKYSDETTDIGKKAYAAAQDVKTFSMMIDTLTESAQSGWAETWQLVVGDFEEAKTLFTNFTQFFDKIISESSEARNTLIGNAMQLQNENGLTGREALWQSLLNVLEHVVKILGAVKKGFHDIFPEITDQRLRSMVESLLKFSEGLDHSEEKLQKVQATFRGIFAVLDMFVTVIRFSFKVSTAVIKAFVRMLETTLFAGVALFLRLMEKIETSDTGFLGWLNRIGRGIDEFSGKVMSMDKLDLKNLTNVLKSFGKDVIGNIFNFGGLNQVFDEFDKDIAPLVDRLRRSFDSAFELPNLSTLKRRFKKDGTEIGGSFSFMGATAKESGMTTSEAMQKMSAALGAVSDTIGKTFDWLVGKVKNSGITLGQVFAVGVGAFFLIFVNSARKFVDSLIDVNKSIANLLNSTSALPKAAAGTLNSISGMFNAMGGRIKAKIIIDVAKAMLMLVGALAALTVLPSDRLYDSIKIMGLLAAGLVAVTIAMGKLGGSLNKKEGVGSMSFAAIIIALAAGVKILISSVKEIQSLDTAGLARSIGIISVLSGTLILTVRMLGTKLKKDESKKYYTSILGLVSIAVVMNLMLKTLDKTSSYDLSGISQSLKAMYAISGILAIVGLSFKNVRFGSALTVLAIIPSIMAIVKAFESFDKIDPASAQRSISIITKVLGMFAVLGLAMSITNRQLSVFDVEVANGKKKVHRSSNNINAIGNMILKMSSSLLTIVTAFKMFGMLKYDEIAKAQSIVPRLLGVFAAITLVSKFAGENASKAGSMIAKMSFALVAIAGVMAVFTLFKDPTVLDYPLKAITQIMLVMSAVIGLTRFAAQSKDVSKVIASITGAMIVLSSIMVILSLIKPDRLQATALAISEVLALFSLVLVASSKMGESKKGLISLAVAVSSLGVVLAILSNYNVESVFQNALALGVLFGSLTASFAILSKSKDLDKGIMAKVALMAGIVGALALLLGVLNENNLSPRINIETAAGIALLMTSLSSAFLIIGKSEEVSWKAVGQITVMMSVLTGIGALIGWLEQNDLTAGIQSAAALGLFINAVSIAFNILGRADAISWKALAQLGALSAGLAIIGGALGVLEKHNWSMGIQNAVSLGILINSLVIAFRILKKADALDWEIVGQLTAISIVLGLLGAAMGIMEKLDIKTSIENAASLSFLLIAIAAACVIASKVGNAGEDAVLGIVAMVGFIGLMSLLMIGIGELARTNPNVMDNIDYAVEVMTKLGEGLGKMVGSFIGNVVGQTALDTLEGFGAGLSAFSAVSDPFFKMIGSVDTSTFSKIESFAKSLLSLTKAEFLNGIALITGGSSWSKFGGELSSLGEGITAFTNNTKDVVSGPHINTAFYVLEQLAALADKIPNSGGVLGWIVGDNNMDDFATQLPLMASGIVSFCYRTKEITYGPHVGQACEAIKMLAKVSQDIPNTGGALGALIGNNDMDRFAEQLPLMANGIVSFCYKTLNINYGPHIQQAADAIKTIANVSKEIPNTGGALGALIGNNDMGYWATQLSSLGTGLFDFCANIDGIKTGSVDSAIDVAKKIANFSHDIANSGGLWQDIFGSVSISDFGSQITWLGYYMWVYYTWIDKITDFDKYEKSVNAFESFANMATIVKSVNVKDFKKLGDGLIEFAQSVRDFPTTFDSATSVVESIVGLTNQVNSVDTAQVAVFGDALIQLGEGLNTFGGDLKKFGSDGLDKYLRVFDNADTEETGKSLTNRMLNGIDSKTNDYEKKAKKLMDSFLKGVDEYIRYRNSGVRAKGAEVSQAFLNGLEEGLDVNSPSEETRWVGQMADKGFVLGVDDGKSSVMNSGVKLATVFMDAVEKRLEVHSPSKWGEWVGSMTTDGMAEGILGGAGGLLNNFGGIWDQMQSLSQEGITGIKDIIGGNSLWDFSASIGENLVTAKDKLKEWLGFGGEGGLSDIFGFGSITEELEKEIEDAYKGVQSGMGGLAGNIASSGGSTLSQLSDALSISMHKHFDYSGFIYLGKQIGEKMAIAASNAIVSKEKALGDTFVEVVAITAGGLETWKAWAEARKYYGQLSLKDELAGWTLIQKMYDEGTKERMEADKEVYTLQQELVKQTFEYSKKWIDTEKYYNRLSLEEELAAWRRVQARYLEGSDERIEADKEVYRVKEELRKRDYDNAKKWIEKEKKLERLSLADELAAYKRILETTTEGSDERTEMEEKIFDLQKEIYETQQQYIEDVKSAQQEAADERLRLEKEYADKVREIEEKLASDISSLNDNYTSALEQRTSTLYKAYGIFDEVKQNEADKDVLMQNMQDQVNAFSDWKSNIQALAARGLDKALIDELTEMGPSAAAEIEALNTMTDAELGKYNLLWSQKMGLAREQAIGELEYLRVETAESIIQLQQDAATELDEYCKTWAEAMKKVTVDCNYKMNELRKDFGETVGLMSKDTQTKLNDMIKASKEILNAAGWDDSGRQLSNGLIQGIESKKQEVLNTVTQLGIDAIKALNNSLEIASPSKATYRSGSFAGEGLINGLAIWRERAYKSGYALGDEIQNGAIEAINYISNAMSNGLSSDIRINPVITMGDSVGLASNFRTAFDMTKAVDSAVGVEAQIIRRQSFEFKNPNENVVQELHELRSDMAKMNEEFTGMKIVLDTGSVVGGIAKPLDRAFGTMYSRNERERW